MHRPIDPKVDCVFKILFGSDDHPDLLIHVLNALLADDLAAPITHVDILNPYNERETLDDKLTVVDVKARDAAQRLFQVEIQLLVFSKLAPRILYAWAHLFSQQLQRGDDHRVLQPVYAIWILDGTLFRDRPEYAHRYRCRDVRGRTLVGHGSIRVYELNLCIRRKGGGEGLPQDARPVNGRRTRLQGIRRRGDARPSAPVGRWWPGRAAPGSRPTAGRNAW